MAEKALQFSATLSPTSAPSRSSFLVAWSSSVEQTMELLAWERYRHIVHRREKSRIDLILIQIDLRY
jgi:hypothetical protein